MRFRMIDRIIGYEPWKRIEAVKVLSLSEEYLGDHFPSFPVMPGVLMLEAMTQAASWLMRLSGGMDGAIYPLVAVKAVRYGGFVVPGNELRLVVEIVGRDGDVTRFKGKGRCGGTNAVVGRFALKRIVPGGLAPGLEREEEILTRFFETQAGALIECERDLGGASRRG